MTPDNNCLEVGTILIICVVAIAFAVHVNLYLKKRRGKDYNAWLLNLIGRVGDEVVFENMADVDLAWDLDMTPERAERFIRSRHDI